MPFKAYHSKLAQGRTFWLVVHLRKPALTLAVSDTMLERVQPSSSNSTIVVDLHTPGITLTMTSAKVLTATVQNLSFQLDCEGSVKLVNDPALQFQLQISIEKLGEYEFSVRTLVGTDEGDTPAVRQVMDLLCQKVNAIESTYHPDAQELLETHEDFKHLAALHRWLVDYEATYCTNEQRDALDTLGSLLRHGNQNRNKDFNGWTIPLPLSNGSCATIWTGLLNREIQITEKGTSAEILRRRELATFTTRQLRQ